MCFKNSFSENYEKIPWKTSVVKSLELQNTELLQNNSAERKAYKQIPPSFQIKGKLRMTLKILRI